MKIFILKFLYLYLILFGYGFVGYYLIFSYAFEKMMDIKKERRYSIILIVSSLVYIVALVIIWRLEHGVK